MHALMFVCLSFKICDFASEFIFYDDEYDVNLCHSKVNKVS